jgi:hypothetical protein
MTDLGAKNMRARQNTADFVESGFLRLKIRLLLQKSGFLR